MADHEIVDVLGGEITPGVEGWSVITRRPDGELHQTTFPKSTMEWRAAEYGLTDPAEILDVILHESALRTLTTDSSMASLEKPPKAARAAARDEGPDLYTAKSTAEAREAHRARIAATKTGRVKVTDPGSMLRHILGDHGMDPERIRAKREAVDVRRWLHQHGRLPVEDPATPNPPLDDTVTRRAAAIRAHAQKEADSA